MKKVCVIASRLFTGGFTTSMLNMISQLEKRGYQVDILFLERERNELSSKLLNEVEISKQRHENCYSFLHRIKLFAEKKKKINSSIKIAQLSIVYRVFAYYPKITLTDYKAVISWEELTCNYFLAYNVKARKKIGYVHPDYRLAGFSKEVDYPVFKRLDRIVSVSEGTLQTMKEEFKKLQNKMVYVPNVNDVEKIREKANVEVETYPKGSFDIVTVCRLDNKSKALDRVLRIVKRLEEEKEEFHWYIVGEGEGRKELEEYIEKNQLKQVSLLGNKENPYPYIKKADLFALLSNYEGRPVAVDEALIIGTPVIVTDYESAKEQVENEVGYIVEKDEEKIYTKIKEIIKDREGLNRKKEVLSRKDMSTYENIDRMIELIEE